MCTTLSIHCTDSGSSNNQGTSCVKKFLLVELSKRLCLHGDHLSSEYVHYKKSLGISWIHGSTDPRMLDEEITTRAIGLTSERWFLTVKPTVQIFMK